MNKKIKKLIAESLLIPFILTACGTRASNNKQENNSKEIISTDEETKGSKVQGNKEEFDELLDSINLSREEVFANAPVIKDEYINWFEKGEEEFSKEEVKEIADYAKQFRNGTIVSTPEAEYDGNRILTYEEAKADVDRLFKLFTYCYGPYGYFGGDEIFNEVKTAIMNDIQGKKEISSLDFKSILTKNLNFIDDAHFTIGSFGDEIIKSQVYYMYNEDFYKDDKGYYKVVDNETFYLNKVNGDQELEKFMEKSINDEGRLVYRVTSMKQMSSNRSISAAMTYTKNEETIEENVYLDALISIPRNRVDKFEYRLIGNIPVAKVAAMHDTESVKDSQLRFEESAEEMKKHPMSILDLRGNRGGYQKAGDNWIERFSGSRDRIEPATALVCSSITNEINETYNYEPFEYIQRESLIPSRIPNNKVLFVLMDKLTMSAGEWFIEELLNMDNVVLVGTNTSGYKLNDLVYYKLKNSKMDVAMGDMLHLTPYGEDFEYKGFQPDILVESDKALDRLLKMIEYYGINENNEG